MVRSLGRLGLFQGSLVFTKQSSHSLDHPVHLPWIQPRSIGVHVQHPSIPINSPSATIFPRDGLLNRECCGTLSVAPQSYHPTQDFSNSRLSRASGHCWCRDSGLVGWNSSSQQRHLAISGIHCCSFLVLGFFFKVLFYLSNLYTPYGAWTCPRSRVDVPPTDPARAPSPTVVLSEQSKHRRASLGWMDISRTFENDLLPCCTLYIAWDLYSFSALILDPKGKGHSFIFPYLKIFSSSQSCPI